MSGIKLCLIVIASKNKLVIYFKKKKITKKKGFLRHKLVNYFRKKKL